MEINIGAPEAIYLSILIIDAIFRVYRDAVESTNRIDLAASIVATVLSVCIDTAILIWGGFFS